MATAIQENLGIPCRSDETIREITRGIRAHFVKFVKPLAGGGLEQAQLGLGHSYSRGKVRNSSPFAAKHKCYKIMKTPQIIANYLRILVNFRLDEERFLILILPPTSAAETTNPSL